MHRRAAEAEDSAEGLVDSDDEGEDREQAKPRSSGKAAGKRPIEEGSSRREGQGSRLRTRCALNIGTEEGTRPRRRALLDSDDDDDVVPLSRVFRVRQSSPEPTPPCRATPP